MSNWKRTLDLKNIWDRPNGMTVPQLGKEVAIRLRKVSEKMTDDQKYEAEDIAECFEDIDPELSEKEQIADFDSIMSELYDFADMELTDTPGQWMKNKLMWIKTSF